MPSLKNDHLETANIAHVQAIGKICSPRLLSHGFTNVLFSVYLHKYRPWPWRVCSPVWRRHSLSIRLKWSKSSFRLNEVNLFRYGVLRMYTVICRHLDRCTPWRFAFHSMRCRTNYAYLKNALSLIENSKFRCMIMRVFWFLFTFNFLYNAVCINIVNITGFNCTLSVQTCIILKDKTAFKFKKALLIYIYLG